MEAELQGTSREIESLLLRRIAQHTQQALADQLGLSTSQLSRIVGGEAGVTLDRIGALLASLGLRVVDTAADAVMVSRQELEALRYFARKAI